MWAFVAIGGDEEVRVSTSKKKLMDNVKKDYDCDPDTPLYFEDRDECIAVLIESCDDEIGIIIKAKVVK